MWKPKAPRRTVDEETRSLLRETGTYKAQAKRAAAKPGILANWQRHADKVRRRAIVRAEECHNRSRELNAARRAAMKENPTE